MTIYVGKIKKNGHLDSLKNLKFRHMPESFHP